MESGEDKPGFIIDYAEDRGVVGFEILDPSSRVEAVASILFKVAV